MAKRVFRLGMLAMVLVFAIVVTGCDEVAQRYFGFNNNSSHNVTVSVVGGGSSFTLAPSQSRNVWLADDVTINDIQFSPANLVSVSRTGNAFFFRDR